MLVARLLSAVPEGDIELACAAVCAGVTGADILSCALMLAFYAGDRRRHGSGEGESVRLTARLLETAPPARRQRLRAQRALDARAPARPARAEEERPRRGRRARGLRHDTRHGHARHRLPVLPPRRPPPRTSYPELTTRQVRGEREAIRREVRSLLALSAAFALASAAALYALAPPHSGRALRLARERALYPPPLPARAVHVPRHRRRRLPQGLGRQVWSMAVNILRRRPRRNPRLHAPAHRRARGPTSASSTSTSS